VELANLGKRGHRGCAHIVAMVCFDKIGRRYPGDAYIGRTYFWTVSLTQQYAE